MRLLLRTIIDGWIKFESKFIRQEKSNPKKLLIFRKDGLGDYIIFLPVLKYYKNIFPKYEITLVVSKIAQELIPKISGVDKFIIFDNKKFSSNIFYRRRFILDLVAKGYETVIYPVFSPETIGDFVVGISRAKKKIGLDGDYTYTQKTKHSLGIYTKLIAVPKEVSTEFERNIFFAKALGAVIEKIPFPTIRPDSNDVAKADKLIKDNGLTNRSFSIIFPGAGQTYKIWPPDRYLEIIGYLKQKNIISVICGTRGDVWATSGILDQMTNTSDAVDLTGQTDIGTLSALLAKSLFYFGSDTGALHLAAAVGTPAICLMGGGHFKRFFPYGDLTKNLVVYDKGMKCLNDNWKCGKNLGLNEPAPCIKGIKTEDAIEKIKSLLEII